MPQPINRILPDAHVILKTTVLADKPDFAILVSQIFATWARIEQQLSFLLVRVLGAEAAPAIAMYSTLTAQHLQLGALVAAAKAALPTGDFEVFKAAISVVDRAQTPRNHLAHWTWAECKQRPDLLALANPKMLSERDFRVAKLIHSASSPTELDPAAIAASVQFDKAEILAYTKSDLERSARDLEEANFIIKQMVDYVDPSFSEALFQHYMAGRTTREDLRAEALEKLNSKRLFREALAQIRLGQKSTPQSHDESNPPVSEK